MVSEGKETVEDACKIPGWAHSDSINLERESERIIRLGVEGRKIKSLFLGMMKFEMPEGHTCRNRMSSSSWIYGYGAREREV